MRRCFSTSAAVCGAVFLSAHAWAEQPPAAPAAVPDKMPFDIPYGGPISMDMARKAVDASLAEAGRRGWKMAISVVSPSGDLTAFVKMDDTQLASANVAPKKARAAARFRRETKVFFEAAETGHSYASTLDPDVVASPGGIPIVVGGKLIGAMGCSGGTGQQDAVICQAGIDALGK